MEKKQLSQITRADLTRLAELVDQEIRDEPWATFEKRPLSAEDEQQVAQVLRRYRGIHVALINEATLWSRLVYPLLLTAEREPIKAWAEVPIFARIADFEIQGVVDGALAAGADAPRAPLLLIMECKRGTEATNPIHALYAALLCVGWNEVEAHGGDEHTCHGCFTIADTWTFIEAEVFAPKGARPRIVVRSSREYSEKLEAHLILAVLKSIEDRWLAKLAPAEPPR
ncbi:MAG: hypothetical protein U0359_31515 [Byssovorax sp.]